MADSVDADLSMGHCLEQSRLGARRSSVQLVRQNQLMKKRTGPKLKGSGGRVEHLSAQDVGEKQVRGERDPGERRVARNRQRLGERGFADPGDVLEEQVSACNQAGHRQSSGLFLSHHDPGEALRKPIQDFGRILEFKRMLQVPYGVAHFGEVPTSLTSNCEHRSPSEWSGRWVEADLGPRCEKNYQQKVGFLLTVWRRVPQRAGAASGIGEPPSRDSLP